MAIQWDMWSNLPGRIQQTRGNEFDFSSISPAAVEAYSNYQAMKPKRRLELLNKYEEANKAITEDRLKEQYQTNLKNRQKFVPEGEENLTPQLKDFTKLKEAGLEFGENTDFGAGRLIEQAKQRGAGNFRYPSPIKTVTDLDKQSLLTDEEREQQKSMGWPEDRDLPEVVAQPYDWYSNGKKKVKEPEVPVFEAGRNEVPALAFEDLTQEDKDAIRLDMLKEALGKEYDDARSAFDEYGALNEYQRMRRAGEQASIWNPQIGKILLDASDRVKEDRIQGWKEAVDITSQRYKQAMELFEKTGIWSFKRDAENYMARLGELMENNPRRAGAKDWWYEGEPEETKATPETDALKALENKIGSGEIADMADFQNEANKELWDKLGADDKRGLESYLSKQIAGRTAARDKEYTDLTTYIQTNVDPGFVNDQAETSLRISTLSSLDNILNKDPKEVTSGDYQTAIAALQKMGNNVRNQFDSKKQLRWNAINSNISNAWKNDDYGKLFGSLMEGAGFLLGEAFGLNEKDMKEIGKNPQQMRIVQETIRAELQKAQAEFNNRARYVNESLSAAQRRVPTGYINLTEKQVSGALPPLTIEQLTAINKDVPADVVAGGAQALANGDTEFKVGNKEYKIDQYVIKEKTAAPAAPAGGGAKDWNKILTGANSGLSQDIINRAVEAKKAGKKTFTSGIRTYTFNGNKIVEKTPDSGDTE